jgi:RND family efflux transporter MFP subunit
MKKLVLAVIAGIALVLIFNKIFLSEGEVSNGRPGGQRGRMAAVAVEVAPVRTDRLIDQGLFTGTLVSQSKFSLTPRISGRIRKLKVDIGSEISNGEVVAELDDEELVLAVKQAEADLEIARANFNESAGLLEIARKELERTETMRKQKVSSDVELERAQASFKTSQARHQVNKAQLANKQAALESAKVRLSYAQVDASWTGGSNQRFVAEKFLDEGAMATTNSPIVSIIDIATLTAVIDVVEKDYFKIQVGQNAEVEAAAIPDCIYPAKVIRIAPLLDSSSRLARIELEISNADFSLKPGMFVTARIIFEAHESAKIVPASSIVRRQNRPGIFLADTASMTARFVAVQLGFSDQENVEIASPTVSGQVVTLGHHLLEDGAPLKIANLESGPTTRANEKAGERK